MVSRRTSFSETLPLTRQNAWPVKDLGCGVLQRLLDRGHRVLDELAPGHLVLNVCHVQIGVQKHDRVADRVNDIYNTE